MNDAIIIFYYYLSIIFRAISDTFIRLTKHRNRMDELIRRLKIFVGYDHRNLEKTINMNDENIYRRIL